MVKAFTGIQSLYEKIPASQQAGVEFAGVQKLSVGVAGQKDWSDAQLCATELTYKLSSAFQSDDQFSQRSCHSAGNWRDPTSPSFIPLGIGCVPEKFDKRKVKIVCRAEIPESGESGHTSGEARREVFARYWAYFPEYDTERSLATEYEDRLELLRAFAGVDSNGAIQSLFNSGHGIRLFSPFHPEDAHFDVQFRQEGRQSICRVVLDPKPEPLDKRGSKQALDAFDEAPVAIEKLVWSYPVLFHRMMSDVFNPKPVGLSPIQPLRVETLGHVRDHLARFQAFIDPYRFGGHRDEYEIANDSSNAVTSGGSVATRPLVVFRDRLKKCVAEAIAEIDEKTVPFYKCNDGLSVWSRHPFCPPTNACYDSGMCNRMYSCGNGLWIDIRGQNTLEATSRIAKNWTPEVVSESISGYAPSYNYDEGTQSYYSFPAKDRSKYDDAGVVYHKLHVSEGTAAFFVVIFHHQGSDKTGDDPRYMRREDMSQSGRFSRESGPESNEEGRDKVVGLSKRFSYTKANIKRKERRNSPDVADHDGWVPASSLETMVNEAARDSNVESPGRIQVKRSDPIPLSSTRGDESSYFSLSTSSEDEKLLKKNVKEIE